MGKLGKTGKENNIFTEIELKIMLINEKIKIHQRSIEKAKKMSGWQGPMEVSGIDYSREKENFVRISFIEGFYMIQQDKKRIEELKKERAELQKSMRRIKKIYASLYGKEEQVYYMRVIKRMTQEAAADELGFSRRHFQRIEASMKEQGLL